VFVAAVDRLGQVFEKEVGQNMTLSGAYVLPYDLEPSAEFVGTFESVWISKTVTMISSTFKKQSLVERDNALGAETRGAIWALGPVPWSSCCRLQS
jgi:hypothetical protein